MKIRAYTTIKKSVGNVVPGHSEIMRAQAVRDKGTHYEVIVHAGRVRIYTKKYWAIEEV